MIPYTATDMLRSMRRNFLLDQPEKTESRNSLLRFIAAIQGALSR